MVGWARGAAVQSRDGNTVRLAHLFGHRPSGSAGGLGHQFWQFSEAHRHDWSGEPAVAGYRATVDEMHLPNVASTIAGSFP